ncbi:hypothetical protein [Kinneretia aquatilis]|uniref:hypothetical protein n=1 Tax=Kinneretia aquatilis TaxID=2070761 RepID=UPI0010574E4B|nr:hypothetical protein [Paucibacter aquatile]
MNVPKDMTDADRRALASMGMTPTNRAATYEEELVHIRSVQQNVLRVIKVDGATPPQGHAVEPAELLQRGRGACYELSRTIEKGLSLHKLETRRVFFLYRQNQPFMSAMFRRGHPSHAAVEVRTSKGWLLVDSITPWMALDLEGMPVAANGIWAHPERFGNEAPYHILLSSWAIRGFYSRRGQLYGSPIPAPEVNWRELSGWLLSSDEDRHLY